METSEGLKRKSLKLADDEQLDKALYGWFIFRSASLNESETFLYIVKHRDGRSQIQSINWLARKV